MNKLLNKSLKRFTVYAGIVLACSIPVYYLAINELWQYELDEHNITLTAEAGREDTFLIIGAITLLTVFFFALILGGFVWLNRSISSRLWRPFYQTLEKIKDFDLTRNTTVKFEPVNIIEFEELNSSINRLLESNVAAFRQQKEFTENAAHELQTPLAIVQSKLDILFQNHQITSEQAVLIEKIQNALSRVSRINKNLLLLAKIENQQFPEKEFIDIAPLLQEIHFLLSDFKEEVSLHLEMAGSPGVGANKILVETMLTNLLMNAIRHSPHPADIHIVLNQNSLSVSNPGTTPLQTEKLFKRFNTASRLTPGSGLGLSIVKEICVRYQWEIGYDFTDNRHIFRVTFTAN
ncbi:sensor histidine kinase [Pedobacter africanus]|uniref:histidine kinase n=1 Tax=Pedobacter africanus TaxID=151894 RepID=A0A1W2AEI0_9SPHI|nr:HAMP domain-containing sensor histidine kinase [Pedobacter africanus]SMC59076.1 Signal transduction histidine kinase [Pedobacter africanus]